jgi:hypothetical protein
MQCHQNCPCACSKEVWVAALPKGELKYRITTAFMLIAFQVAVIETTSAVPSVPFWAKL